ncbi:MAG: hypothetical protein DMG97_11795 [Acidobacteria bacterium]|nr:MAG: hypothetical protein DMG98_03100 [Acidobacteriota bacterium]PYV73146.1 MAG: hypothetical protein DMG97_11795 [Acidobacteriota bacterium]
MYDTYYVPHSIICQEEISRRVWNRVGGGVTPGVLPHHRTCGSASGGSDSTSRWTPLPFG